MLVHHPEKKTVLSLNQLAQVEEARAENQVRKEKQVRMTSLPLTVEKSPNPW